MAVALSVLGALDRVAFKEVRTEEEAQLGVHRHLLDVCGLLEDDR
jgi:hypothetical protein